MREIKFRAWDNDEKKFWMEAQRAYDYGAGGNPTPAESFGVVLGDDNFVVEQFTGLKDKNCVEIYEGDVIRCALMFEGTSLPHMGEVAWDNEHGCWSTRNLAGLTPFLKHELIDGREVIGNIHQNPELVK